MPRLLKIVALMLVLVASGVFIMSCGSGGNAQVRVINAIDMNSSTNLDVYINGTKEFTNVAFDQVYPTQTTPAAYVSVPSGNVTVQAYDTGTTTNGIFGNSAESASLSGSTQYTMLLGGFLNTSASVSLLTDNNTVPTSGNMEVRVINGAASSASGEGIGVAIYQNGQTPPSPTSVAFGQSTGYVSLPFESGQTYFVEVFLGGTQNQLFTYSFVPGGSATAGQITTLVVLDNPGGNNGINDTPVSMIDLN